MKNILVNTVVALSLTSTMAMAGDPAIDQFQPGDFWALGDSTQVGTCDAGIHVLDLDDVVAVDNGNVIADNGKLAAMNSNKVRLRFIVDEVNGNGQIMTMFELRQRPDGFHVKKQVSTAGLNNPDDVENYAPGEMVFTKITGCSVPTN